MEQDLQNLQKSIQIDFLMLELQNNMLFGFAAEHVVLQFQHQKIYLDTFYQRAFDQVIHDIAIQKLGVLMCVDRAGIVGNDGETHQGIFDLSFFGMIPNLIVMAPKDFKEFENMLEYAARS